MSGPGDARIVPFPARAGSRYPVSREQSSGLSSERRAPLDPYREHAQFPDRWRAYLHAHFRGPDQVAAAFGVTERAARKWWQGIGGCKGAAVVVAVQLHPDTAPDMLFREAA